MEPSGSNESVDDRVNDCQVDRISQLPDPILEIILCNLTKEKGTPDVVKTMLLAKRWKNLWASVPYLSFSVSRGNYTKMVRYITSLLLHRDSSSIESFSLLWRDNIDDRTRVRPLVDWMQYVVFRNVKMLELDLGVGDNVDKPMEFPHFIFTCETLEELRLRVNCIGAYLTSHVHLVRLRKLQLHHFYLDRHEMKQLISGCPVLQDLELESGHLVDPEICSDTLTKLKIYVMWEICGLLIKISCPKLRSLTLEYCEIATADILLENVSSLEEASIQIDRHCSDAKSENQEPIKFLTRQNQYESRPGLPTFTNLKDLTLNGVHLKRNFSTITNFMDASPNLELLRIEDINKQFGLEQWAYDCPHYEMDITYECGGEHEELASLMEDYMSIKCDCPLVEYEALSWEDYCHCDCDCNCSFEDEDDIS